MTRNPDAVDLAVRTTKPDLRTVLRTERHVVTGLLGADRADKSRSEPGSPAELVPLVPLAPPAAVGRRSSRLPLLAGAGVLALLVAGGGYALTAGRSDGPGVGSLVGATATRSASASPSAPVPVARVLVPGGATIAGAGAGDAASALAAGQPVPGGATIAVTSGPTAIQFTDGSILRLDTGSSFTAGTEASRGSLTRGRAWNRAAAAYTLTTTSGPVSAGAGSAFAIDCTGGACRTFGFAGTVSGASGSVAAGYGTIGGAVKPTNWDMTFALPFLRSAADADARVSGSYPDAISLSRRIGVRFASFAGIFTGTRVVSACTGTDCDSAIKVGNRAARSYTFSVTCTRSFPCTGIGSTQYVQGTQRRTAKVPMTYDGTQIRYRFTSTFAPCDDGTGRARASFVWTFRPITAGVLGNAWAVTRTTGTAKVTNASSSVGSCGRLQGTNTATVDVRRTT